MKIPKNIKTEKKPRQTDLEKKVTEGAKKAVQEYRAVFERLSEYDRK